MLSANLRRGAAGSQGGCGASQVDHMDFLGEAAGAPAGAAWQGCKAFAHGLHGVAHAHWQQLTRAAKRPCDGKKKKMFTAGSVVNVVFFPSEKKQTK